MMLTRLERNCHARLPRFTGREWKCVKFRETLSTNVLKAMALLPIQRHRYIQNQ